jgi:hypothetical protein
MEGAQLKKVELEAHSTAYLHGLTAAKAFQQNGLYKLALNAAVATWDHIDGMLQYDARFASNSVTRIEAIDLVLNYAPLLLDYKRITTLEAFCKSCRRLTKNDAFDVENQIVDARTRLWENHRLWSHLADNGDSLQSELRQKLGGDQDRWRSVSEAWEKMGLVRRTPYQNSYWLRLSTSMGQLVPAKCSRCGCREEAPKAMFLEKMKCSKCRVSSLFVFCN